LFHAAILLYVLGTALWLATRGWKRLAASERYWLLCMGLPVPLVLSAMDLVNPGRRALIPRYLMPLWIVILVLVALGSDSKKMRSRVLFASFLALGAVSSVNYLRAPVWWTSHPTDSASATMLLAKNQERRPIVVEPKTDPIGLLSISVALDPSTPLWVLHDAQTIRQRLGAGAFLLFSPSEALLAQLRPLYELTSTADPSLWATVARSPSVERPLLPR
ncbi:MAG: hypothetical protein ACXVBW_12760, partial [Bdellovibrionota bacterium]